MRVRAFYAVAVAIAVLVEGAGGRAADVAVPVSLQGELLVKVAAYDKNLPSRAGSKVHVLVVVKSGDVSSEHAAKQIEKSLGGFSTIAGLPHDEEEIGWSNAAALASVTKQRHASIVYVTPGFDEGEVSNIASAFSGVDVLTAGAIAGYAPKGIVLGFDLVSSKPKLLCNLGQAKRQNVAFKAEVLKLMKVYE